ncbi:MBL fold metallo-hydrolase [Roseibium sp.]|uniref:MBL fold metallo-hydrolase n=1 Tax=Roseibium sp. TaxID=1936156 RepID=UPI003B5083CB
MKLTVLGSGSPEPYSRRASSGYLIEAGGEKILFDCGGGVVSRLLEAGYSPADIDCVFFTHLHSDHMMDYARLVHAAWEMGGKQLKIFGPKPLQHIHDCLFGPEGALAHDLRARIDFAPSQEVWRARGGKGPRPWPAPEITEIEPGFALDTGRWRLSSCSVPHAQPHLICMAFRLESGEKTFVYSGDAGPCNDLERLATGADLLLHWCYRLDGEPAQPLMAQMTPTPTEIAAFAKSAGVRRLLLTHFRVHMDRPERLSSAKEALGKVFGNNATVVEDLEVYKI